MGGWLVAQLLWVLALAAVPGLHERLHAHGGHSEHAVEGEAHHEESSGDHGGGDGLPDEHACAVELFLAGAVSAAPAPATAVKPLLLRRAEPIPGEGTLFVSSFRRRGVLEHAPPAGA